MRLPLRIAKPCLSYWEDYWEASTTIRWVEQFRTSMLPFTRGAYSNYSDLLIHDWPTMYFGEKIAKLKKVKKNYDPKNVFRFEQHSTMITKRRQRLDRRHQVVIIAQFFLSISPSRHQGCKHLYTHSLAGSFRFQFPFVLYGRQTQLSYLLGYSYIPF